MHQNLFTLFLLIGFNSFSQIQADSILTDTIYYKNGQIHRLVDYGYYNGELKMNGKYTEYSENNILLVDGKYEINSDSLECIDCFVVLRDSAFKPIFKSEFNEERTGIWKYYHPNGQLKEKGKYSNKIRVTTTQTLFSSKTQYQQNGPSPVGIGPEYLKTGPWEYYDENGNLTKVIWYYEGRVIKIQYAPGRN